MITLRRLLFTLVLMALASLAVAQEACEATPAPPRSTTGLDHDGSKLVAGRVEVISGCMAFGTLTLAPLAELTYTEEDVTAFEPYGTAELGAPEGIESDGGALGVRVLLPDRGAGDEAEGVNAQIDVIGPDDDRSDAEGEAILADLVPGAYVVTATATGYDVAQAVIPVRQGEAVKLAITLEPLFLEETAR